MDFEKLKIKEYNHWELFIHPSQAYLGRTYLVLKRDGDLDLTDTTEIEQNEFFKITKNIKRTLDELFNPTRLNFAQLGNTWHHLHVHIIPRYDDPPEREFNEIKFIDERPNGNYAPYNKDFKIPEETFYKIKNSIKEKLK